VPRTVLGQCNFLLLSSLHTRSHHLLLRTNLIKLFSRCIIRLGSPIHIDDGKLFQRSLANWVPQKVAPTPKDRQITSTSTWTWVPYANETEDIYIYSNRWTWPYKLSWNTISHMVAVTWHDARRDNSKWPNTYATLEQVGIHRTLLNELM
jgi:hypothetical protein